MSQITGKSSIGYRHRRHHLFKFIHQCKHHKPWIEILAGRMIREGFSDRLSLKMGLEYYVDNFQGKYGPYKDSEFPGLNEFGPNLISIFIPKATIGIQYSFGWGF